MAKKLTAKQTKEGSDKPLKVGIDLSNDDYRKVVQLIDMVKGEPMGCVVELLTIAEVQVRWHVSDFEEKLSLYELIIKRIREHTERL